jgi:cold shock protein
MQTGTIKRYYADRGFGFIASDWGNVDMFFHVSAFTAGPGIEPTAKARVAYEVGTDSRTGRERAIRVDLI